MIAIFAPSRRAKATLLGALAYVLVSAVAIPAHAGGKLYAQYTISMTGVSIGHIDWLVDISEELYVTSANGNASGILSVLINGEGSVATHGSVTNGHIAPAYFTSKTTDHDGNTESRVIFDAGFVKEVVSQKPLITSKRVPVTEADRSNAIDPLSAMLIPADSGTKFLSASICDRVLLIFDGQRRYNLALSYHGIQKINVASGYSGPALVCSAILQPIAGYDPDSKIVKYVAGRRDIEMWFAPITGTSFIAPIRMLMPTLIGTLEIKAEQFDAIEFPTSHAPIAPSELLR